MASSDQLRRSQTSVTFEDLQGLQSSKHQQLQVIAPQQLQVIAQLQVIVPPPQVIAALLHVIAQLQVIAPLLLQVISARPRRKPCPIGAALTGRKGSGSIPCLRPACLPTVGLCADTMLKYVHTADLAASDLAVAI